jgi:hypothetical protein
MGVMKSAHKMSNYLMGRNHSGHEKRLLKWILKKYGVRMQTGLRWLRIQSTTEPF